MRREVVEELGVAAGAIDFTESDLVVSHICPNKPVCLHFYCKKVELDLLRNIEKEVHDSPQYGLEASIDIGYIKCNQTWCICRVAWSHLLEIGI